ncbi:hypothetical protein [Dermacoccus nishinomiyaensis]|uniref:hypothetical protein n=1 Tax=Dermacoccus nishinomiyaensis TaxID=1274 RepID=UPI001F50D97C|nr:hypothetical protein [Dermacoccus nishinomiyaensis]MCI0152858.1 hypothetical protein [Dermacoccus nishinomiyaensis]
MSRTKESRPARCTSVDGRRPPAPLDIARERVIHDAFPGDGRRAPRPRRPPHTGPGSLAQPAAGSLQRNSTMLPTAAPWEHRGCVLFWWAILGLNQ